MLSATAPDERPALLTLDMAVGQMMAASFGGPDITEGLRRLILDEKVGTVLIFRDNFTDAANLNRLTTQLLRLGREAGLPAPLLVAVDEEGGRVSRLAGLIGSQPSPRVLAASHTPEEVYSIALARGEAMKRLGITIDFAPVADVNEPDANHAASVGRF